MKYNKTKVKKILCFKPRGIGDIVLSTIVLENLHSYFSSAEIDYLTEEFAKDALKNNPLVNKVLTIEKKEFPLKAALRLRKGKYDLIIDMWSNPRSAQITFLSGIKYRVGFAYRGRKYAYNLPATSERGKYHSAEHNLELLKPLGVPVISKRIHYYVNEDDDNFAKTFIKSKSLQDDILFGIVPSGGWASKRCDAEKWVEICKSIAQKYSAKYLILWGPGDENDATFIKQKLPDQTELAPVTSVSQLSGLISNCDFILANDSGPMHISAALGKPTLGIFGPTNPEKHGPYSETSDYVIKKDLFCIICNRQTCPYNHECFLQLSNEIVLDKVDELIQRNKIPAARL